MTDANTTHGGNEGLPPVSFVTFILSLAASCHMHMGLVPNPATDKQEKNLPLAKQTIDLLDILKEKTKGNLTKEEEELFEGILYDLRMRYIETNSKHQIPNKFQ